METNPTNFRFGVSAATLLGLLAASATAFAQSTTRVSVDASGVEGNGYSGSYYGESPAISADNRFVAFESLAKNLVSGDTNGSMDIFVKELATGAIVRVSIDSAGVQGNRDSAYPSLSADGRFVAFMSMSDNLVAGDTNNTQDIFLHDRDPDGNGIYDEGNGVTTRVSVRSNGAQANNASGFPMISADGSTVSYYSYATNLVTGDTNKCADVFVYDRLTAKTTRVSVDSAGAQASDASYYSALSADGQVVAFTSHANNLVAGDANGAQDVFVRDRTSGQTTRVSVDSSGVEANASSDLPAISADGNVVAYMSNATNLVVGDSNNVADVFVRDRATGATERVSVDSAGNQGDIDSYSGNLILSADGRIVTFTSAADNLVANDTNGYADVFVHDRKTAVTTRVSVDSSGAEGNVGGAASGISADGELVAFASDSTNLVANDTNAQTDVFVRDRAVAIASNYGAGWPGTLGVPTFVASADPVLGSSLTLTISNSLGVDTPALVLIGLNEANVVTSKGGTLLVNPILFIPLLVHVAGENLNGSIPNDPTLVGVAVDLQALEIDGGASKGMAFTNGLKLLLGY
jgi:hypothetical protein